MEKPEFWKTKLKENVDLYIEKDATGITIKVFDTETKDYHILYRNFISIKQLVGE